METIALYLVKSVIWISGFLLIYYLFLRNERFFLINRIFLLSGIIASFLLPLVTLSYSVSIPAPMDIKTGPAEAVTVLTARGGWIPDIFAVLITLYIIGAAVVASLFAIKSRTVLRSVKKAEVISASPVKVLRTSDYPTSFSFFSWVFVNPSASDIETREIVNHEMVHISQKHWADLVLGELLCVLQWFNPLSWVYIHFIRQNHEFLADEGALQRSPDPALYRATLLNQVIGLPVFSLSNSFNYSLTKKRFKMMKNIVTSPYRKMRVLLILPVMAAILVAFAKPEYRSSSTGNPNGDETITVVDQDQSIVKGVVVQKDGKPLEGAVVLVKGSTIGTTTDSKGVFTLSKIPADASLVVSFVGFKTREIKPAFTSSMKIDMERQVIEYKGGGTPPPPPPPPPPPVDSKALVVINGKISAQKIDEIDPASIESVNILKDKLATDKYGEKGKYGVIEITMKSGVATKGSENKVVKDAFIVIEELPQYPGGEEALMNWLGENVKYPGEAVKKGITGKVFVEFIVGRDGKISNAKVTESINPLLDAEAVRVISRMPAWKPGTQSGKPVDVYMKIPVDFKLN